MRPVLFLFAAFAIVGCRQADAHPIPSTAGGVQQGKAAPAAKSTPDPRLTRADLARIDGKPGAKLWILVISDFQCPYCKEFNDKTAKQVHKEFVETGVARLAYINYPLKIHRNAVPASEAAMCAGAQDKFWPFHDKLFATVARWGNAADPTATYLGIAGELKLNLDVFRKCLADDVMLPMIDADYKRGTQAGATSTPTFLIGRIMIPGNAPIDVFRTAIKETLAGNM
jgi:protein-disulfide isomerase